MSSPDAPRTLVEQVKAGDQTALERLLLEHSDTLSTHIAQRIPASLRSVIGVEDVMQQTFMRAFDKIDQLQDSSPGAFVAWLKAIGATTLMGIIKTERRQKRGGKFRQVQHVKNNVTESLVDLLEQLPGDVATASRVISRREAVTALQVGISSLPPEQRKAIELYLVRGKTLEQTAKQMQRTPAAIRGLVHRGKQKLADTMGRASLWLSSR